MHTHLALSLAIALAPLALGGSETPPAGPPWHRSLLKAQQAALASKTPIFVYFTKTY